MARLVTLVFCTPLQKQIGFRGGTQKVWGVLVQQYRCLVVDPGLCASCRMLCCNKCILLKSEYSNRSVSTARRTVCTTGIFAVEWFSLNVWYLVPYHYRCSARNCVQPLLVVQSARRVLAPCAVVCAVERKMANLKTSCLNVAPSFAFTLGSGWWRRVLCTSSMWPERVR